MQLINSLMLTLNCLSTMVYHEARGEEFAGQVKVAAVAVNRAYLTGLSVCRVVNRPNQFSPRLREVTQPSLSKRKVQVVASLIALSGIYTTSSTHFESGGNYLERKFKLRYEFTIGRHRFYTENAYYARRVSRQQPRTISVNTDARFSSSPPQYLGANYSNETYSAGEN